MTSFTVIVHGQPAPQGSKKFVGTNKAGRGIMVESSKKVRPWRQDVKAAAEAVVASMGTARELATGKDVRVFRTGELTVAAFPIDAPTIVRMVFTVPKPASAPKRRTTYPSKKPDLSKLARSTEDALVDAGLLLDDSRIIEYQRLAKVFPGEDPEALQSPGVRIEIIPRAA
jgi:hypothetical protein